MPISWSRISGGLTLTCTIPAGINATLRVPQLVSGTPTVTLDGQTVSNPTINGRYVVLPVGTGAHRVFVGTRQEVENPAEANTAGVTYALQSDAAASNGQWAKLNSTGVGQYVEYTLPNITAGVTYNVTAGVKFAPTRGQAQMAVGGVDHGALLDEYSSTFNFGEINIGTFSKSTGGSYAFRFTVTGKNAASTGYDLGFDYIILTPQ